MTKKILAIALTAALSCTALLAGCGGDTENTAETNSTTGGATLTMATNAEFPPYEYMESNEVVGIDVDIAQAICDKLGMTLAIDNIAFDSIIPAVQSGKADVGIAGMTVTEDRLQSIDFTDPYTTATQVIIVNAEGSTVASVDDLAGKTIGVQLGTTGDIYASDVEGATVEQYQKGADAVQALKQNKIDCVIIDSEPAKAFVAANEGLTILPDPFEEEEYAICISKDNSELKDKINTALSELKADGTIDSIVAKYIGSDAE